MKKLLCLLLCLVFPVSALAEVCVLFSDLSDTFSASIRADLVPLLEQASMGYSVMDAHGSQWTQMDQGMLLAEKSPEAVAIQACEYGSLSAARAVAGPLLEKGIPVIFFGRVMYPDAASGRAFFQGQDRAWYLNHDVPRLGLTQGQAAGQYLAAHYDACDLDGDGRISCVVLQGDVMDEDACTRSASSVEAVNDILVSKGFPRLCGIQGDEPPVLSDPDSLWSARFAKSEMDRILQRTMPELVLCGNDDMAIGAVNALSEKGYNTDLPGAPCIPVYGIDLSPVAQSLIAQGRMYGSVGRSPAEMAAMLAQALSDIREGLDPALRFSDQTEDGWKIVVPYACICLAP